MELKRGCFVDLLRFVLTEERNGLGHHFRSPFSTYDQDNDMITEQCAIIRQGAWWFNDCCASNLNSIYSAGAIVESTGCCGGVVSICWNNLPGPDHNIKYTEMKIRPVQV